MEWERRGGREGKGEREESKKCITG